MGTTVADLQNLTTRVLDAGGATRLLRTVVETPITAVLVPDAGIVAATAAGLRPEDGGIVGLSWIGGATVAINARYQALGSAGGVLGPTTSAIAQCPDEQGFYRHFQNGSIYWSESSGAHEVIGVIRDKWAQLGWERSLLGYPTSGELGTHDPAGRGRYNRFQHGAIYATPDEVSVAGVSAVNVRTTALRAPLSAALAASAKGLTALRTRPVAVVSPTSTSIISAAPTARAFEVHGAIHAKYAGMGAEASVLGAPLTDESTTPDGVGRYNHFQAGSIYWSPQTGAHEVHGLIREHWGSQGWERNPALGYPISDESIPDRRIGHVHPESRRKPIGMMPVDLIKVPVVAAAAGFPPSVLASPRTITTATIATATIATPLVTAASGSVVGNGVKTSTTLVTSLATAGILAGPGAQSSEAPSKSRNRFGDFENGVLFWRRGTMSAESLAPFTQSADGGDVQLTVAQLAALVQGRLSEALRSDAGIEVAGLSFAGTTPYSYDGAGVQNRRHRFTATLRGQGPSIFGIGGFLPAMAMVNLEVLVSFEPIARKVVSTFASWSIAAIPVPFNVSLNDALAARLDPRLWEPFVALDIDDTNDGQPVAVLSVKTMPNGDVNVYVEPQDA